MIDIAIAVDGVLWGGTAFWIFASNKSEDTKLAVAFVVFVMTIAFLWFA